MVLFWVRNHLTTRSPGRHAGGNGRAAIHVALAQPARHPRASETLVPFTQAIIMLDKRRATPINNPFIYQVKLQKLMILISYF